MERKFGGRMSELQALVTGAVHGGLIAAPARGLQIDAEIVTDDEGYLPEIKVKGLESGEEVTVRVDQHSTGPFLVLGKGTDGVWVVEDFALLEAGDYPELLSAFLGWFQQATQRAAVGRFGPGFVGELTGLDGK